MIAAANKKHQTVLIKLLCMQPKLGIHAWRKIFYLYNDNPINFSHKLETLLNQKLSSRIIYQVKNFNHKKLIFF